MMSLKPFSWDDIRTSFLAQQKTFILLSIVLTLCPTVMMFVLGTIPEEMRKTGQIMFSDIPFSGWLGFITIMIGAIYMIWYAMIMGGFYYAFQQPLIFAQGFLHKNTQKSILMGFLYTSRNLLLYVVFLVGAFFVLAILSVVAQQPFGMFYFVLCVLVVVLTIFFPIIWGQYQMIPLILNHPRMSFAQARQGVKQSGCLKKIIILITVTSVISNLVSMVISWANVKLFASSSVPYQFLDCVIQYLGFYIMLLGQYGTGYILMNAYLDNAKQVN